MRVPSALLGPAVPSDRWRAAATAGALGLLAGVLRFRALGTPAAVVFDETYYAKDAWALLQTGAERVWSEGSNDRILVGDASRLTDQAAFASHPPLGKWVIAVGEAVGGLGPVGWRLGAAAMGTLAVVVMVYLARRVTRSTLLGGLAGLLLALDGLALTVSRLALLDGTLLLLVLVAAAALVRDRDWSRERMADDLRASPADEPVVRVPFWRPWRLLMGVALGAACATKWSGLPVLAVFGVLTVVWQAGALADAGHPNPSRRALLSDGPVAFVTVAGSAALTYLVSWSGWLLGSDGYERQWAASNPASSPLGALVPDALRALVHYHAVQYDALSNLQSDHSWKSNPIGWLVLVRPVLFYRDKPTLGIDGCRAEQCVSDILGLGTPTTWWLGVAALALLVWRAAARRDWRAWLVVGGVAATWLPWFAYTSRAIFQFYAVVTLPFLVLAIVLAVRLGPNAWARPGPAQGRDATWWRVLTVCVIVVTTLAQVTFFWPILTAQPLPLEEWQLRIWLPGWS